MIPRSSQDPTRLLGVGLRVCWREGRYAEAEHAFQQAEALQPSSGRAHMMLGLLYSDMKRNREALRELQTGLKSEPANPQGLEARENCRGRTLQALLQTLIL